jgi:tRNA modification GTPase
LLKEERAIVSNIAGTTRDTIEEVLHIKGHAFRLIDTAGLRETMDEIEAIGVKKAKEKVENANILVYLADAATEDFSEDIEMIQSLLRDDLKLIICATKIDEVSPATYEKVEDIFRNAISQEFDFIKISAVENQNIQDLKNELSSYVEQLKASENNVVITNQRHFEALQKSLDAVQK